MKNKILGMFICMLLMAAAVPAAESKVSVNQPPVFGTPTPLNNSMNNALSLSWSIPINDPEGDIFLWTIQCSNTQTIGGTGALNGTKLLALSNLAYLTPYTVWVNATDPTGSGLYTRKWYTFTTKANHPPVFGSPTPANGSTYNPLRLNWSIPINDSDGNAFSWVIQCSNGQVSNGIGATNGTKSLALSGLAYLVAYKVWVNATDPTGSGTYTRKWYTFITKASLPPVFGTLSTANGSTNSPLSFNWSIPINDPEGDAFSWTIQCDNRQTSSGTGAWNGTKSLELSGLKKATTYKVWVNATDPTGSGLYTRKWYTFTTVASPPPHQPTIDGPANGKTGVSYNYNFVTSDPEGDDVYYRIIWGDGSPVTEWYGPYHSGQLIIVSHTFLKTGTFIIQCQAKDIYNALSNWGQLDVIMPVSTSIYLPLFHQLIEKLFERFPHAFPVLRQLLGY